MKMSFENSIKIQIDDKFVVIPNILLDDYKPDEQGLSSLVVEKHAQLQAEQVGHHLIDGEERVHMTTFSQCERECSLASQSKSLANENGQTKDFSCISFAFCHADSGQPASCQLSSHILTSLNEAQLKEKILPNARCNVFQVNPLAQFHVARDVQWLKKDSKFLLLAEQESNERSCAMRCLSLGPICRSFTTQIETTSDQSQVTCEYFSAYNHYTQDLDSLLHFQHADNFNIYSSEFFWRVFLWLQIACLIPL